VLAETSVDQALKRDLATQYVPLAPWRLRQAIEKRI
jgi:hypothetical protein